MKKIDENGFWNYEANPISKVGVFPYLGSQIDESLEPDKVYYVYRPAEELFSEEAIASFNAVPVPLVDDHTMIGKDYTPAEQKGVDGVISNVRQSGDELIGDLAIYSESMKDKINHGKKDLSMGYFCSYDLTPGEWNGQHYDAIQRDIRSNHVALVKDGRCGHSVRVYDSFCLDNNTAQDFFWEESKHKRDDDGKFTSMGGENKSLSSEFKLPSLKHEFEDDPNLPEWQKRAEAKADREARMLLKPIAPFLDKLQKKYGKKGEELFEKTMNAVASAKMAFSPEGAEIKRDIDKLNYLRDATKKHLEKMGLSKGKNGEMQKNGKKYGLVEKIKDIPQHMKFFDRVEAGLNERDKSKGEKILEKMATAVAPKGMKQLARLGENPTAEQEENFISKKIFGKSKDEGVKEMQATDADFKESDHPRDKDGKFTSGGGSSSGGTSGGNNPKKSSTNKNTSTQSGSKDPDSKSLKSKFNFSSDPYESISKYYKSDFINHDRLDDSKKWVDYVNNLSKEERDAYFKQMTDEKWNHFYKAQADVEEYWQNDDDTEDSQISESKGVKMKNLKAAKDGDLIVKHDDEEEEKTMDASVDKRELIREIGAIAGQGGLSDELVRTLMQKAEELAYNGSEETPADDACDEDDTEEEIDIKEEEKAEDEDTLEEDKEEEKEVNDEDEEEEEKKDEDLAKSLDAMPKKIMKMIATRDSLVEQLKPIIGSFNYQSKTADQVAKYACDALNLKVSKASDAHACIRGYLAGYKKSQKVYSMDTAATTQVTNNQIEKYLKGE